MQGNLPTFSWERMSKDEAEIQQRRGQARGQGRAPQGEAALLDYILQVSNVPGIYSGSCAYLIHYNEREVMRHTHKWKSRRQHSYGKLRYTYTCEICGISRRAGKGGKDA